MIRASCRDVELARQISAAARELDLLADNAVQTVQVSLDALVGSQVMPFWRVVLGYREMEDEDDEAEARVAAAIAAGGHLINDEHAPAWWTLADAEGNEVDVATWMGRD